MEETAFLFIINMLFNIGVIAYVTLRCSALEERVEGLKFSISKERTKWHYLEAVKDYHKNEFQQQMEDDGK